MPKKQVEYEILLRDCDKGFIVKKVVGTPFEHDDRLMYRHDAPKWLLEDKNTGLIVFQARTKKELFEVWKDNKGRYYDIANNPKSNYKNYITRFEAVRKANQ